MRRAAVQLEAQVRNGNMTADLRAATADQQQKVASALHAFRNGGDGKLPPLTHGISCFDCKAQRLVAWSAPWCASLVQRIFDAKPCPPARMLIDGKCTGNKSLAEAMVLWCHYMQPTKSVEDLVGAACDVEQVEAALSNSGNAQTRRYGKVCKAIVKLVQQ